MRLTRVFTDQPLEVGIEVSLESGAVRHLRQVLRLHSGDPVVLFNGDGKDYRGKILLRGKNDACVSTTSKSREEPPTRLGIMLGLGISRGERMDFALQKSVELGVAAIAPLVTERIGYRSTSEHLQRRWGHWHRITISACEQSGRSRLPALYPITSLTDWLSEVDAYPGFLLNPRSTTGLHQMPHPGERVSILAGPEGGLSERENDLALAQGFQGIRMGPRVLRTETAPLVAIAAIQTLWGDFRDTSPD